MSGFCQSCGVRLTPEAKFCGNCGGATDSKPSVKDAPPNISRLPRLSLKPKEVGTLQSGFGILLFVVGGLGLIIAFFSFLFLL